MRAPRLLATTSILASGALLLGACSSSSKSAPKKTTTTTKAITCPLTGLPAPGNQVPQRPAVSAKIDNYSAARPQSGLEAADIIFEEPVEGGITRFNAFFQCQNSDKIGPIRSARQIDIGINSMFNNAGLAHIGGIDPVLQNITASGIPNLDLGNYGNSFVRDNSRYAPYNAYTSTAQLYALVPNQHTPPNPVYTYSTTVPSGTVVTSFNANFSFEANVTWSWDAASGTWLRFYNETTPDKQLDGKQNNAVNVIVQTIHTTLGPWVENSGGGLEVQAELWNTSGPAKIFRNGVMIEGTWSRGDKSSPTVFKDAKGKVIAMNPGRTWVELFPDTSQFSFVAAPVTTTTAKKK